MYKRRKNCVLLPAAGRRTQIFILLFLEPGVCGFADPCTYIFKIEIVNVTYSYLSFNPILIQVFERTVVEAERWIFILIGNVELDAEVGSKVIM